jgi:WhiB family redox-sensing transcriptional regulator
VAENQQAKIRSRAIGANYVKAPSADDVVWQLRGTCASSNDPDLWMAPSAQKKMIQKAKEACRECPVISECAKWALDTHQEYGVWGGLSEIDRQDIWGKRRNRRRTAA